MILDYIMYIYTIIFFITLFIIIIIYILYHNRINTIETFEDKFYNIQFLTYKETSDFLLNDPDKYVTNMSDADLYARKVKSKNEYLENISKNSISFNIKEQEKLYRCTKVADNFFSSYNNIINGNDIVDIKWKFALVNINNNIEYEEGLPHTRNDIIFLSKYVLNNEDHNLTNILIHEKVHIYQRYNKDKIEKIIYDMGYRILQKKNNTKLLRANPDLNDNIYYDSKNNIEMIGLYKNNTPHGINDIILTNFSIEHPYEKIAYDIAEEYNKIHINKYINI